MTRKSSVSPAWQLTGLVVSAAALVFAMIGCGEEPTTAQPPAAKAREEASTKNMADFMKSKPAPIGPGPAVKKDPSAPQTK